MRVSCTEMQRRRGENQTWWRRVQNDELFFCFFSGTNMMMSKQKQKSKHAMEKKIFLLDSLTLLCDCTDLSQIHFHALWSSKRHKKKKMPPHASTFDLIWTIYFCLRYGQAETEVGVWRQIASIYSSKLKVLSWAVRAYFHFPLH